MAKKDLEALSDEGLGEYSNRCFEHDDTDEVYRIILEFEKRGLESNAPNYFENESAYNRAEKKMSLIGKLNEIEFENLNTFELQIIISNESKLYSEKESKKALNIFIKKKKTMPNYSENDPDMLWANNMIGYFGQSSKINWMSILFPIILLFGFLFQLIYIRDRGLSPYSLSVFGVLIVLSVGYSIFKNKKK